MKQIAILMVCLAGSASAGESDQREIRVPPALKFPYSVQQRPGSNGAIWLGVVLAEGLPVYAGPTGDARAADAEALKFGEVLYLISKDKVSQRVLAARFDVKTEQFIRLIGWLECDWILDDPTPLTVESARKYVHGIYPEGTEERKWLDRMLPQGTDGRSNNILLKAFPHPTKGHFAFKYPVPADQFELRAQTARVGEGRSIQRFAFYYVVRLVVRANQAYVVLSTDSELVIYDPGEDGAAALKLVGIVPLEVVTLVPTRTGLVPNFLETAYALRMDHDRPLQLFDTMEQAIAAARGSSTDKFGNPVKARWEEPRHSAERSPIPVPDASYGFLVLSATNLKTETGETAIYHVAVPGKLHAGPARELIDVELDKYRKRLLDATIQMRTVELVFVVDATGSMAPVYQPLLVAVREYAKALAAAEVSRPALDQIKLRVGIVLYRDYGDRLGKTVEDSDGYFDLSTQKGLEDFEHYMLRAATLCRDGGDRLEQPFVGISTAIEAYCGIGSHYHTPGASSLLMVMGDNGNHPKGEAGTTLDVEGVCKLLSKTDAQGTFTRVMVNPTYIQFDGFVCPDWTVQMRRIAEATDGLQTMIPFATRSVISDATPSVTMPDLLQQRISQVVERQRAAAARERAGIVASFTQDTDGTPILGIDARRGISRIEEIIPPADLKEMQKKLGQTIFFYLFAPAAMPGDDPAQPRWLPRVLLTTNEVVRLSVACRELSRILKSELAKLNGNHAPEVYKELIIRCLYAVMEGRAPTAAELERHRKGPVVELEDLVSQLPVRFACLRDLKPTLGRPDIQLLYRTLDTKAQALEKAMSERTPHQAALDSGELHVAIRPEELP